MNQQRITPFPKSRVTPPQILYKYYGDDASKYLFNERKQLSIKYSLLADYNDCMELSPYTDATLPYVSPEQIDDTLKKIACECNSSLERETFFKKMAQAIYELYGRVFPANNKEEFKEARDPIMYSILSNIIKRGVLCTCFSEKFDIDLMWAQYANRHKGFCVGYRTNRFPKQKFVKVCYQKSRIQMRADTECNELYGSRESCYTKGGQWKYEKEWRCVHASEIPWLFLDPLRYLPDEIQSVKGNFICYHDPECVASIFFGVNSSREMQEKIRELLRDYSSIKYYQMFPNSKIFALDHRSL